MTKYFVKTHNKLPTSKWIWDNLDDLDRLLNKMISKKPRDIDFDIDRDLEDSLKIISFDPEVCVMWKKIFKTNGNINWNTVREMDYDDTESV